MQYDADQCLGEMKKDLVKLKNSDLVGSKMKLRCKQFLI